VVMISTIIGDNSVLGLDRALQLLRMKPEDATSERIAQVLDLPNDKIAPDRPLLELLVAEIHPEHKTTLITELGTGCATPREIEGAARSLGIKDHDLFVLPRRVPVTRGVLQHGHPEQAVNALLDVAQVYAWNMMPGQAHSMPESVMARLAAFPFTRWTGYPELNVVGLRPGLLPRCV